jgi:hypothetical protein
MEGNSVVAKFKTLCRHSPRGAEKRQAVTVLRFEPETSKTSSRSTDHTVATFICRHHHNFHVTEFTWFLTRLTHCWYKSSENDVLFLEML